MCGRSLPSPLDPTSSEKEERSSDKKTDKKAKCAMTFSCMRITERRKVCPASYFVMASAFWTIHTDLRNTKDVADVARRGDLPNCSAQSGHDFRSHKHVGPNRVVLVAPCSYTGWAMTASRKVKKIWGNLFGHSYSTVRNFGRIRMSFPERATINPAEGFGSHSETLPLPLTILIHLSICLLEFLLIWLFSPY